MPFSDEEIEQLMAEYQTVSGKYEALLNAYGSRIYVSPRAKEYATQGFSRRLKTLVRYIENVFEIMPPNRVKLPSKDELSDAEINIQAFVFNTFGSIDNLAWIWVQEKNIFQENGEVIPDKYVGLKQQNKIVRGSFSQEFREYLDGLDAWIAHLEDFRHSLAHRIPLYIPPCEIPPSKHNVYEELEARMTEAIRQHDFDAYARLSAEQRALGRVCFTMRHSFEEDLRGRIFPAQLLADFNTIDELGQKFLKELNR